MKPLLVLDGDSLGHRAYHALPRSIRDAAAPGNMIVGFANMLLGLWDAERPRATLARWDTVGAPTWRHELLPDWTAASRLVGEWGLTALASRLAAAAPAPPEPG